MECLGSWVTCYGIKPIYLKIEALKYDITELPKGSLQVYRFSYLLSRYVGKTLTYVSNFNYGNIR